MKGNAIILRLGLNLLCVNVALGQSSPLLISGVVDYTYFFSDSHFEKSASPFNIVIGGCNWYLRIVPANEFVPQVEIAFDSETMYVLEYRDQKRGVGYLRRMPIPHFLEVPTANAVWLTYASGCYFKKTTGTRIPPPVVAEVVGGGPYDPFKPFTVPFKASFTGNAIGTPSSMYCLDDGGSNLIARVPYPPPFDKEAFTNVVFKVFQSTNMNGIVLPLRSSLQVFALRPTMRDTAKMELAKLSEYVTICTNVMLQNAVVSYRPEIPGRITMWDQRFWTPQTPLIISYFGVKWLSESQAKKLPEFRIQEAKLGKAPSMWKRPLMLSLLFIVAALPIVVRLLKRKAVT